MERFWSHFGSQNKAKIIKKSIQNSIEILVGFLIGSWTVLGGFWERFGDPGPSKISVSLKRGAIFEKITFFRPDSVLDGFFIDFGWFWEHWEPFWLQNRIQKSINKSIRFWMDFGIIVAPKLGQSWAHFGSKNRSKIKVEF